MAIWTVKSGTVLASIQEGMFSSIALPAKFPTSIQLISGNLPPGLRLTSDFKITGTPEEVPAEKNFRFVLRAVKGTNTEDRTFTITVIGEDPPQWITPSGLLPVGTKQTLFVLDNSPVDFKLQVIDQDTRAGEQLRYFIPNNSGTLPSGLQLTEDGRIIGQINPILAIESDAGRGSYDENKFDKYPFDFAILDPESRVPKKLNQFYQFIVAVSDGDTIAEREFDIFVVGEDFLRADNTILEIGFGIFTADNTYVRSPIWLTPAYLGTQRANNNLTLVLDIVDPLGSVGKVNYKLEKQNPDGTVSELPPGTSLDENTGEIFGRVPYQPAVVNNFKFTVTATRELRDTEETASTTKTFNVDIIGEIDSTIRWITPSDLGTVDANYQSLLKLKAETTVPNSFLQYYIVSGNLPPGLRLDESGEILGQIQNENIDQSSEFNFTVKARDQFRLSEIERPFQLKVTKENDTLYSNIYYKPLLPQNERNLYYDLISDPEIFDPELIYRPNDQNYGLQQQIKILIYAGLELQQARDYITAVALHAKRKTLKVRDIKVAEAKELGTNKIVYEVVYLDVYDPYEKDNDVTPTIKINTKNKITVDSLSLDNLSKFNQRILNISTRLNPAQKIMFQYNIEITKRNNDIASIHVAEGILDRSNNVLDLPIDIESSTNIVIPPRHTNTVKADTNAIKANDTLTYKKYISNISQLREELNNLGSTNRDNLPLWMRTAQPGRAQELGFTLAAPLCFCKPGAGTRIKRAIEFANLDFRQFELDVDRIIVEETENNENEIYFVFANREYNI